MATGDDALEGDLRLYDFSQNHPIRDDLLSRLLNMRRMDSAPRFVRGHRLFSDEELDCVVAAGNPVMTELKAARNKMTK